MPEHKFAVGQTVEFLPGLGAYSPKGQYTIVRLLPDAGNTPQYRIKNKRDGQERMVQETQLSRWPSQIAAAKAGLGGSGLR